MKKSWVAAMLALLLGVGVSSSAPAQGVSVGLDAGTLGAGVEIGRRLTGDLKGRIGLFGYSYGLDFTAAGIDYTGHLDLRHAVALVDWHPGGRVFRLSAGLVANDSELSGEESLRQLVEKYAPGDPRLALLPQDLGSLKASIKANSLAPYVGIGLGRGVGESGHWGFTLDLGTYYQGSPDARLSISTSLPIASIPGAQELVDEALATEQQQLQDVVSDYRWFPVVMFGASYRF